MKLASFVLMLVLVLVTGCDKGVADSPQKVSSEISGNMKKMTTVLDGITDEASAKAALPKIAEIRASMRALKARAEALPKLSAAEVKALDESVAKDSKEIQEGFVAAMNNLRAKPDLFKIIEPAFEGMENDL